MNWRRGSLLIDTDNGEKKYRYSATICDTPSETYGIEGGKIIKMYITETQGNTTRVAAQYERGWEIEPETETDIQACAAIVYRFNQ